VRLVTSEKRIDEFLLPRRHAQLRFRNRRLALDGRYRAAEVGGEGVLGGHSWEEGRVASLSVGTALDHARLAGGNSDDADGGVSLGIAGFVGFYVPGRCSPPPCGAREGIANFNCVAVGVVVRVVVCVWVSVSLVGSCPSSGSWAQGVMEASEAPC